MKSTLGPGLSMPIKYDLRVADSADYDALGELMFDAIHNGPTKYTPAQSKAWAPVARSGPDWAARLCKQHIIVAERDGQIQGFMSIEPGGYVDFAYIRPVAQGSGLFRRLFDAVLRFENAAVDEVAHGFFAGQPEGAVGFAAGEFGCWSVGFFLGRWTDGDVVALAPADD